jgi:hypothetical protein
MTKRAFFNGSEPIVSPWGALRHAYKVWYGLDIGDKGPNYDAWRERLSVHWANSPEADLISKSLEPLLGFSTALLEAQGKSISPTQTSPLMPICHELQPPRGDVNILLFAHARWRHLKYGYIADKRQNLGPVFREYDIDPDPEDLENCDEPIMKSPPMSVVGLDPLDFILTLSLKNFCYYGSTLHPNGKAFQFIRDSPNNNNDVTFLLEAQFGSPFKYNDLAIFEAPEIIAATYYEAGAWTIALRAESREACESIPEGLMASLRFSDDIFDHHDWG